MPAVSPLLKGPTVSARLLPLLPSLLSVGVLDAPLQRSRWNFQSLVGRVTELSAQGAGASLSFAMELVLDAQRQGESVVWITAQARCFYPPDAVACGVDLEALAIVRVPGHKNLLHPADRLVRSGAVGLAVLDLGKQTFLPNADLARLAGLARKHETAIVCLTEKAPRAPSLGALIALRCDARRAPLGDAGTVDCSLRAEQKGASRWTLDETYRVPHGLC